MAAKGTLEEFIQKAKKIHGDKYDYSETEYVNSRTVVKIICPKHGPFYTTPNQHLSGKRGCRFCGYEKISEIKGSTTKEFINKAKMIWGDRFNYSKVNYVNSSTKVCIIDENGNEFWQTPNNHLSGFNGSINKLDTESFIKRSLQVHGDKYDYSKVRYINAKSKVCIICPEHGEFWQLPHGHLKGQGCLKCSILKCGESIKSNTEDFIRKSRLVHGDKYDYSKVEYVTNRTKVCIVCPEHGEFWQIPTNHLKGVGCIECKGRPIKTVEQFISDSRKVHGDKYDYSKVDYINSKTKVCIICPEHGEFWQLPGNHINKIQGCPTCAKFFRKKEIDLYNTLTDAFPNERIIHSYYKAEILSKQEIDIFFPKYNIGIEFQGEQHFIPIDFAGLGSDFARTLYQDCQVRDLKKKEICQKNGITLLYFSNVDNDTFLGEKLYHTYAELIEKINQIIKKESEKQV